MIHRLLLTGISVMTLATCSTKKEENRSSPTSQITKTSEVSVIEEKSPTEEKAGEEVTTKTVENKTPVSKTEEKKATSTPVQKSTNKSTPSATVSSAKSSSSVQSGKRAAYFFSEGENRFLRDYEMNITFRKITEDSRCPTGVNCIWQGAATAQIEVMGTYTRPQTLSLSTTDLKGYTKSAVFNGYRITLVSVEPYPSESKNYKNLSGTYKIGLTIMKDGTVPKPNERSTTATR